MTGRANPAQANIHPTAVIHTGAVIGKGCVIGPYCVVGEHVILGAGVQLHSHVVLAGRLTIGDNVQVFPFASIGQKAQDLKYRGGIGTVTIGERTVLREYVTINQPTFPDGMTSLGADCSILAYCHIAHDCKVGKGVIMSNCVQLAGHVEVGDYAVLGGLAAVHQFCRIGTLSMVGACAKLVMDAVPFCLFDGYPATPRSLNKVNLKRHDIAEDDIRVLTALFKVFFRSGRSSNEALAAAERLNPDNMYVRTFAEFVRHSERGVARPSGK